STAVRVRDVHTGGSIARVSAAATSHICTLSLHDALPISGGRSTCGRGRSAPASWVCSRWSHAGSYQCRPTEADGGGAADPDLVVLGRDRDDSGPPQRGALRESVGVRSAAGSYQPLWCRGVETGGDRVLGDSGAGGEGTDLVLVLRPFGVGAEDADLGLGDRGEVRFESEHLLGAAQTQGRPAGSVVDPLMVDD